jgi:hypothetical protein
LVAEAIVERFRLYHSKKAENDDEDEKDSKMTLNRNRRRQTLRGVTS